MRTPKRSALRCSRKGLKRALLAQRNATLEHLLWYSISALVGVIVLAAVVGWLLAGRILRPVHQLTIAARNASENNLSQRLALTGPRDELRELADTFDDMLARLGEAFAGQQRFLANASHELRTPLTVMRTTLDVVLAKSAPTNAELVAMGNDVRSSVEAAEHLIASLLTLARNERGRTVDLPIDLATTAEDVLDALSTDGLTTTVDLQSAPVFGDPILLERLVANLVDNAVRYNVPAGTITVASGAQNDHSFVRVSNTGTLIPPELVDSLFHPFTRLDDRTRHDGFGLGLALVASIASIHDARIEAIAGAAGGLDITVRFIQATLPIGVERVGERGVFVAAARPRADGLRGDCSRSQ